MLSKTEFIRNVTSAYDHLYDLVYLRSHPLVDVIMPGSTLRRKEIAWNVHRILLGVIEELDPGPQAPVFSREWRRHRLMVLHYVDGLDPQVVADELAISRRHFYREHKAALEAVADILWNRYVEKTSQMTPDDSPAQGQENLDRLALLRTEVARLNQTNRYTRLQKIVEGVVELMQEMARRNNIKIQIKLQDNATRIGIDQNILRQTLLGLLSYLVEHSGQGEIYVEDQWEKEKVLLTLRHHSRQIAADWVQAVNADRNFSMLSELATMQEAQIEPVTEQDRKGFNVVLPILPPRTILIADDNEDILQLFQRYLRQHNYQVVVVQTSAEVIALAEKLRPFAIILDLMMPDKDGWDTLQILTHQPETQHIPIIVCTVLGTKQLALSLGAAAFLEKPVSEQALLQTLHRLEEE